MVASKGEPIFARVNMHGFRWKFMAPSSSHARNSVMKIAERSSLKILPSPNTSGSSHNGNPDSKVHGANMGPTWVLSAPHGPHIGPMNLAICEVIPCHDVIMVDHVRTNYIGVTWCMNTATGNEMIKFISIKYDVQYYCFSLPLSQ